MARLKTNRRVTIALFLCLACAASPLAAAEQFTALVTAVADGGTITVLTQDKQQVKIRLFGIDCPQRGQAFAARIKQATSDAVFGKNVTVQPIDTDRYGWTAAVVFMPGGKSLNEYLVREGMAWVERQSCTREDICTPLRKLENAAKGQKRGLWEDKGPVSSQDMQFTFGVGGSGGVPGDELKHPGASSPSGSSGDLGRKNK